MSHVDGVDGGIGYGVRGRSNTGYGVRGNSDSLYGMIGQSNSGAGVVGTSTSGVGVGGSSSTASGVYGFSFSSLGGVFGESYDSSGVYGRSKTNAGVYGQSNSAAGVYGNSVNGVGVYGVSTNNLAAYLYGNVEITGNLSVGSLSKDGGWFKIDHPLDPANKYLSHSFVESPDMKNVYDGVVVLDDKGEAVIELPDWFGALNKDFRYQLTAIGAPGPNLYIAEEISDDAVTTSNYNNNKSRFKVAGGASGMKVSWQVTGIRKDPWANAHRIPVEEDKPDKERGYYTYPELYGQPEEKGISHLFVPEIEKELLINK
jgi:hypothetical protein